jgi:hypothetical protein
MPQFNFFNSNFSEDSISDEATNLADDEDFINIAENLEISIAASMEKYGNKTIAVLKADLDKISNLKDREEKEYQILRELEGLKKTPIPDVKYADLIYTRYTSRCEQG